MKKLIKNITIILLTISIATSSFAGTYTFSGQDGVPLGIMSQKTIEENPAIGWVITSIVLCCLSAEVGSDGWKVSWKCDCFSKMYAAGANQHFVHAFESQFLRLTGVNTSEIQTIEFSK